MTTRTRTVEKLQHLKRVSSEASAAGASVYPGSEKSSSTFSPLFAPCVLPNFTQAGFTGSVSPHLYLEGDKSQGSLGGGGANSWQRV